MEKTIQIFVVGTVLTIISISVACQKVGDADLAHPTLHSKNLAAFAENNTPANPGNPCDSAGYWHNLILSGIQPCVPVDDPGLDRVVGCTIQFAETARVPMHPIVPNTIAILAGDKANRYDTVISNLSYSAKTKSLMETLIRIVEENAARKDLTYGAIKQSIMNFESQLQSDRSIADYDRTILLQGCSVARYSIYYWQYLNRYGQAFRLKNIVKWAANVAGDVSGILATGDVVFAAACSEAMFNLTDTYMR